MSLFNLDRFRFERNPANRDRDNGSKSPESEKENKPGNQQLHVRASVALLIARCVKMLLLAVPVRL